MDMNQRSVANMYRQQSVMTASPGELTLMLYNGCIKDIKLASQCIKDNDVAKAHNYIVNAQNIIRELSNTLDMHYPISSEIKALYDFILAKLIEGNIKKNINALNEALDIVEEFRATWFQVIKLAAQEGIKNAI